MVRTNHRRRRQVNRGVVRLLQPVVRYSYPRDAYILRGVGRHLGPVLEVRLVDESQPREVTQER